MSVVTLTLYEEYRDRIWNDFQASAQANELAGLNDELFDQFKMVYLTKIFHSEFNLEKNKEYLQVLKFVLQEQLHPFPEDELVEPNEPFYVFSDGYYELCYFILYPLTLTDIKW
jgi:hypothetical protein